MVYPKILAILFSIGIVVLFIYSICPKKIIITSHKQSLEEIEENTKSEMATKYNNHHATKTKTDEEIISKIWGTLFVSTVGEYARDHGFNNVEFKVDLNMKPKETIFDRCSFGDCVFRFPYEGNEYMFNSCYFENTVFPE